MTAADEFRGRISNASAQANAALLGWNAGDVKCCQDACDLLNTAISELQIGQKLALEHPIHRTRELAAQIDNLRTAVRRLTHVVDASMAFCRGLDARSGNVQPATGSPSPVCTQG